MMQDQNYDLIIVGAGMAGCILAARIAENGINPRNGEPLRIALLLWPPCETESLYQCRS
jgi:succinate dehydrogenase/fumarate reductase flavoprotein subunit